MANATTDQELVAHEVIEGSKHQVVVIRILIDDVTNSADARELGAQLQSLIQCADHPYFVIDCAGVRTLGSTALSELLSFALKARPVWFCNLDASVRAGAALVGLDNWARFAVDRNTAIKDAERTARWDEEDTVDYPARAR